MHDFEGHHPGAEFLHWPQHIALTPLLAPKKGLERSEVIDCITDTLSTVEPFYIQVGERAMYGKDNDIPVIKIADETGRLHEVHESLIKNLGSLGCYFDSLEYSLHKYSPHTKHKDTHVLKTQPHLVNSFTIGEKLPKSVNMHKRIIKRIILQP